MDPTYEVSGHFRSSTLERIYESAMPYKLPKDPTTALTVASITVRYLVTMSLRLLLCGTAGRRFYKTHFHTMGRTQ